MSLGNVYNVPRTNITGTDGGSNFTFPVFDNGIFWLEGVLIVPDPLSPPRPFHSVSSESGAVEFASKQTKQKM